MVLQRTRRVFGWLAKKLDDLYTHPIDKENREREAYLKTPEGQEELRQERISALKFEIKSNACKGNLTKVEAGLESLIAVSGEDKPSPEEIKDTIYQAGKNHAAIAYARRGVDLENLAHTIGSVSVISQNLLGDEFIFGDGFDSAEFITFAHRKLVGDAKTYLKSITKKPNNAQEAYSAAQRAEQILELTDYTPEEKQEKVVEINKLLASAMLPGLRALALQGLATEFEDVRAKVYEAMDKAQTTPEIREKTETLVNIYHGKCYNEHFKNHMKLFMGDVISLEDLDQVAKEHNRVFDALDISPEDREKNNLMPVAAFNPNTYRLGIKNLLYRIDPAARNGNPIPPEKEAKDMVTRIQNYLKQAELKPAERKGVIRAFRRIDSFYNGHSNGHNSGGRNDRKNQMYKNPQYDRRARLAKKRR